MDVKPLVIVPARVGSKGIRFKNFTALAGKTPLARALEVAATCTPDHNIVVTTDATQDVLHVAGLSVWLNRVNWLHRPATLASDDAPMVEVVRHVLGEFQGASDQSIALLQCTQPLRKSEHITQALELLNQGVARVISVTSIESPDKLLRMNDFGILIPWGDRYTERRQDARPAWKRDGTVYAWRRHDADPFALPAVPLIIPASDTCPLDTEADWLEAERRVIEKAQRECKHAKTNYLEEASYVCEDCGADV